MPFSCTNEESRHGQVQGLESGSNTHFGARGKLVPYIAQGLKRSHENTCIQIERCRTDQDWLQEKQLKKKTENELPKNV